MRNVTKFLTAFVAVATFTLIACNKDSAEIVPTAITEQSESREKSEMTEEEREDIAKTIKEIEGYKEKFDNWRQGKSTEERIDVKTASEQIEMIWNYNVSRPGTIFEKYEFVTAVAEVGDTEVKDWTGAEAAHAYEAVKEQIVKLYNGIEGGDKGIVMIDMGNPELGEKGYVIKMVINIGNGLIEKGVKKAEGRSDSRWAFSNYGFTPNTSCAGEAETRIGQDVNSSLGYFLKNLQPFSTFAPGNPQVNASVVKIMSPIDHTQTNYFGTTFPLAGFPPPLFVRKTTDYPTGATGAPSYTDRGKYRIHADEAFGGTLPDENCFNSTKIAEYVNDNKFVGINIHQPDVNTILGTSFKNRRIYISTYVVANKLDPGNQQFSVKVQEHATYHFFARVVKKLVPADDTIPVPPLEM